MVKASQLDREGEKQWELQKEFEVENEGQWNTTLGRYLVMNQLVRQRESVSERAESKQMVLMRLRGVVSTIRVQLDGTL